MGVLRQHKAELSDQEISALLTMSSDVWGMLYDEQRDRNGALSRDDAHPIWATFTQVGIHFESHQMQHRDQPITVWTWSVPEAFAQKRYGVGTIQKSKHCVRCSCRLLRMQLPCSLNSVRRSRPTGQHLRLGRHSRSRLARGIPLTRPGIRARTPIAHQAIRLCPALSNNYAVYARSVASPLPAYTYVECATRAELHATYYAKSLNTVSNIKASSATTSAPTSQDVVLFQRLFA